MKRIIFHITTILLTVCATRAAQAQEGKQIDGVINSLYKVGINTYNCLCKYAKVLVYYKLVINIARDYTAYNANFLRHTTIWRDKKKLLPFSTAEGKGELQQPTLLGSIYYVR